MERPLRSKTTAHLLRLLGRAKYRALIRRARADRHADRYWLRDLLSSLDDLLGQPRTKVHVRTEHVTVILCRYAVDQFPERR